MRKSLHDAWWRIATTPPRSLSERLLAGTLQSGVGIYQWGVGAKNLAYDHGWIRPARLPRPVISVGNLTVGGAGKTACVAWLAEKLRGAGKRVSVLSRGYGGTVATPAVLLQHEGALQLNGRPAAEADGLPDEPQLLAKALPGVPVLIGARREQTGWLAIQQHHADVLVLDDGFQHRRLHRDCDLVVVQARMPLGGWPLLPRGPMREPLTSLRRADAIILTKSDQSLPVLGALEERLRAINPDAVMAAAVHEPAVLVDAVSGAERPAAEAARLQAHLLSSIGDPEGFEQTLRRLGATVLSHTVYPDHHPYTAEDWRTLAASGSGGDGWITTEKDLVRLGRFVRAEPPRRGRVWVLRVRMRFLSGEQDVDDRLARVCDR
ncbi:MAG: tetraacyldisaccharide 4'-kinase [Candidatus Omnitrophica bacterium]|nr:tetraacyldisaccharide 4'-kinase [Candidatus Omnitrophota bacterium]